MKTTLIQVSVLLALAWAGLAPNSHAQALLPVQDHPDGPWYMPGEILIKFKPGSNDAQLESAIRAAGVIAADHFQTPAMKADGGNGLTRAATSRPVAQAIKALENHPAVAFAQPNWVYTHQANSNDPFYLNGGLWGMYGPDTKPANGFGSGAGTAWAAGSIGSQAVFVGVIDEGIEFNHDDLAANIWKNPGEFGKNQGFDDDNNGYTDDIYGWNALNDNGNTYDAAYDDHGTHVAGTIGAAGGNQLGVVGVNWNVSLITGKFLGPNGGSTLDAVQAIDYMTQLKTQQGINIVALNNSWSGGGFDQALLEAITRAATADILLVAAAGNGNRVGKAINTDSSPVYPACYDTTAGAGYDAVISVTAIDKNGAKPSWANYGSQTVDLGAPGVDIWSTTPGSSYASYNGTSMATPHVTGAIALYASQYPGAKADQIKATLLASTAPATSLSSTVTKGRLDVAKFLSTPPPGWQSPAPDPPRAPSAFSAESLSSSEIKLSWTDNSNNETFFQITRWTTDSSASDMITVGPNLTSYLDAGLTDKTSYNYSIQACNSGACSVPVEASATTQPLPEPAFVKYVAKDTTSKGSWIGRYGGEGHNVIYYDIDYPDYATVKLAGDSGWVWSYSTTDSRALQKPDQTAGRHIGCHFSDSSFTIDLTVNDAAPRRVAFYIVDWETTARAQTIELYDFARNKLLHSQNVSSFNGGQYLIYEIQGRVLIRFTRTGGQNAVLSGIFFDSVPVPPNAAPTDLSATTVSRNQINLAWKDNSNNEGGFKIERSTKPDTGWSQIAVAAAGATSYASTGLSRNTTYYYRVRATNSGGDSEYSNTASATTLR